MQAFVLAASPYVAAGFGLAGSLIGGAIAGSVSLAVARQAREAAERSWMRDSRREIYDRFLTSAQRLLVACEEAGRTGDRSPAAVREAYVDVFDVYGVVQSVAELPVVATVRVYAYRLLELTAILDADGRLAADDFDEVAQLVRRARHDTIDAMRVDLGLADSARPPDRFNPFLGTPLAERYELGRHGAVPPGRRGPQPPP